MLKKGLALILIVAVLITLGTCVFRSFERNNLESKNPSEAKYSVVQETPAGKYMYYTMGLDDNKPVFIIKNYWEMRNGRWFLVLDEKTLDERFGLVTYWRR